MNDYDELEILRKVTTLNIIDILRIRREYTKAEELVFRISECDPTHSYTTDYTAALKLEKKLRMKKLKYNLYEAWQKFNSIEEDDFTLEQCALRYINEQKEKGISKKLK